MGNVDEACGCVEVGEGSGVYSPCQWHMGLELSGGVGSQRDLDDWMRTNLPRIAVNPARLEATGQWLAKAVGILPPGYARRLPEAMRRAYARQLEKTGATIPRWGPSFQA